MKAKNCYLLSGPHNAVIEGKDDTPTACFPMDEAKSAHVPSEGTLVSWPFSAGTVTCLKCLETAGGSVFLGGGAFPMSLPLSGAFSPLVPVPAVLDCEPL